MKRTLAKMAVALVLPSLGFSSLPAQPGAVVQPLPPEGAVERLNSNLARLSRSPQDVEALLGAGQAALDLGDIQAANGFFTRANLVNPNSGRVKLSLAKAELALKQPEDAAANFDAAAALGENSGDFLSDRGLAYDLTGQQAKAQRDYRAALASDPKNSQTTIRYAVSLGISGQLTEADKILEPILAAGDREAWRFRAFIYAMNGRRDDARNITASVMPKGLADALEPYMARVSLLTPAQKAAAAHYGDFPANVLAMAPPANGPAPAQASAPREQPQPAASNRSSDSSRSRSRRDREPKADTAKPAQAKAEAAKVESPAPAAAKPAPVQVATAAPPVAPPPAPTNERSAPRPVTAQPLVDPQPARAPAPQVASPSPVEPERSLEDMLGTLNVPAAEKARTAPPVDLESVARLQQEQARKEAAAREQARKEAEDRAEAQRKAKLKDNPARIFVQIASGRNLSALEADLGRLKRTYGDAIGDETGWTYPYGRSFKLLVGPYRNLAGAKAAISAIEKAGGDAFVWESEAGNEVRKLGGK